MANANFFIKGRDNPAVINFTFSGGFTLDDFTKIVFEIGGESYDSSVDTSAVSYSGSTLILSIGDVTELAAGFYEATITGYSALYDDGYQLAGSGVRTIGKMEVRNG